MSGNIDIIPDYRKALAQRNRRKIVEAIAKMGGTANFSDIERSTGIKANVLVHNLNVLRKFGVVDNITKGTYRLRYKTPLCYIYQQPRPQDLAYFGLLGKKDDRKIPETEVARQLLAKEGFHPKLTYVLTSTEALEGWKSLKLQYQWIMCYENEISDIDAIKRKIEPQLESLLKDFLVILDCTSATKPATIAYYELAQKYLAPLIYVYEPVRKLKWLISKQSLRKIFFV